MSFKKTYLGSTQDYNRAFNFTPFTKQCPNPLTIIAGVYGTGKTTLMKELDDNAFDNNKRVINLDFTGEYKKWTLNPKHQGIIIDVDETTTPNELAKYFIQSPESAIDLYISPYLDLVNGNFYQLMHKLLIMIKQQDKSIPQYLNIDDAEKLMIFNHAMLYETGDIIKEIESTPASVTLSFSYLYNMPFYRLFDFQYGRTISDLLAHSQYLHLFNLFPEDDNQLKSCLMRDYLRFDKKDLNTLNSSLYPHQILTFNFNHYKCCKWTMIIDDPIHRGQREELKRETNNNMNNPLNSRITQLIKYSNKLSRQKTQLQHAVNKLYEQYHNQKLKNLQMTCKKPFISINTTLLIVKSTSIQPQKHQYIQLQKQWNKKIVNTKKKLQN